MTTPAEIRIRISPTIEAEFKRRKVFAELRREKAIRRIGQSSVHSVTVARAEQIQNDAERHAVNPKVPLGVRRAYSVLGHRIDVFIWADKRERNAVAAVDAQKQLHELKVETAKLESAIASAKRKFSCGTDRPGARQRPLSPQERGTTRRALNAWWLRRAGKAA